MLHQRISSQALLSAFNQCFLLLALCFLGMSWVVVFMRRPKPNAVDASAAH